MAANQAFFIKILIVSCIVITLFYALYSSNNNDVATRKNEPHQIFINTTNYKLTKTKSTEESSTDVSLLEHEKIFKKLKIFTKCLDIKLLPKLYQNGDYWVLKNYVIAQQQFKCEESVTYVSHGDFTFLDNLEALVEKWRGPVSIALYAPGSDFTDALESVAYLVYCTTNLVREYVSFHLYFHKDHLPEKIPKPNQFPSFYNCFKKPPFKNSSRITYKSQHNLRYPVNVGRNIARQAAQTHFILVSDIELYPSPNIIGNFLDLVANSGEMLEKRVPYVFPLHLFEIKEDAVMPATKTGLQEMLKSGSAIPFHEHVCSQCHSIPEAEAWINAKETSGLNVFNVGKRQGKFGNWEPIYIGTNAEPFYDERLSWDGKRDKMTQGYALCVMDYNFLILDNAFLVHRPGIKYYHYDADREKIVDETNYLIGNTISRELILFYGSSSACVI